MASFFFPVSFSYGGAGLIGLGSILGVLVEFNFLLKGCLNTTIQSHSETEGIKVLSYVWMS